MQLKEKVWVDLVIIFGVEVVVMFGNSINNVLNDEIVFCSLQYLSDEYDDFLVFNFGVVD